MTDHDLAQFAPYTTVDFNALAKKDESFNLLWQKSSGHIDFQDPGTTSILSKAILKTDFNLALEVLDDRLCPPIPNRWNYVSWIQNLLDSTNPDYSGRYDPYRHVVGLDIGTGASAIYAMLCLRSRPNWTMCATDIDKISFDSAVRNLSINNLVARTKMLQTTPSDPLIPFQYLDVEKLDFTICNPPFFNDTNEMHSSLNGETKVWKPNAVCTGAEVEMVCPGGDLGFVTRIVEESLVLREKVRWYSSMLGKMSSAKAIVTLLKKNGIDNWAIGAIEAGTSTKRWVVAWSFGNSRPRQDIARIEKIANEFLPFPTEYKIPLPLGYDITTAVSSLNSQLSLLDLRWRWDHGALTGVGETSQIVWNRAYRRELERRKKQAASVAAAAGESNPDMAMEGQEDKKEMELVFRVSFYEKERTVAIEWLRGTDRVTWESFCSMMHRGFK